MYVYYDDLPDSKLEWENSRPGAQSSVRGFGPVWAQGNLKINENRNKVLQNVTVHGFCTSCVSILLEVTQLWRAALLSPNLRSCGSESTLLIQTRIHLQSIQTSWPHIRRIYDGIAARFFRFFQLFGLAHPGGARGFRSRAQVGGGARWRIAVVSSGCHMLPQHQIAGRMLRYDPIWSFMFQDVQHFVHEGCRHQPPFPSKLPSHYRRPLFVLLLATAWRCSVG